VTDGFGEGLREIWEKKRDIMTGARDNSAERKWFYMFGWIRALTYA